MIANCRDEIIKILLDVINDNVSEKEVTMDTRFKDIGIRSIQFIKALVTIKMKFNIEFDDDDLEIGTYKTVGHFIRFIEEKIKLAEKSNLLEVTN